MEILEGHHQQWTAQLAGLSGDFRAANTGNLGDARQQLIAPGVVTRQCHYLSVLFYPFRELTPTRSVAKSRAIIRLKLRKREWAASPPTMNSGGREALETEELKPVGVLFPGHQFFGTLAGSFGDPAAHEGATVSYTHLTLPTSDLV